MDIPIVVKANMTPIIYRQDMHWSYTKYLIIKAKVGVAHKITHQLSYYFYVLNTIIQTDQSIQAIDTALFIKSNALNWFV